MVVLVMVVGALFVICNFADVVAWIAKIGHYFREVADLASTRGDLDSARGSSRRRPA